MIAVDSNLLIYAHRKEAKFNEPAFACLKELAEGAAQWGICYHSFVEFYGVVTRSGLWGRPSLPHEACDQIEAWMESPSLQVLVDHPRQMEGLLESLVETRIEGAMVHDARIANCCLAHGVTKFYTLDRDFSRFPALKTENPFVGTKGQKPK